MDDGCIEWGPSFNSVIIVNATYSRTLEMLAQHEEHTWVVSINLMNLKITGLQDVTEHD